MHFPSLRRHGSFCQGIQIGFGHCPTFRASLRRCPQIVPTARAMPQTQTDRPTAPTIPASQPNHRHHEQSASENPIRNVEIPQKTSRSPHAAEANADESKFSDRLVPALSSLPAEDGATGIGNNPIERIGIREGNSIAIDRRAQGAVAPNPEDGRDDQEKQRNAGQRVEEEAFSSFLPRRRAFRDRSGIPGSDPAWRGDHSRRMGNGRATPDRRARTTRLRKMHSPK